jgi:predicted DNA-binding transcriptional regulator YafY
MPRGDARVNVIANRLCRLMFYVPRHEAIDMETLQQLAAWCSVSTRTVRRDLDALKAAGFKVPPYAYREAA